MGAKEIIIIVLVIAAIPALFMLVVGVLGGLDNKKRKWVGKLNKDDLLSRFCWVFQRPGRVEIHYAAQPNGCRLLEK